VLVAERFPEFGVKSLPAASPVRSRGNAIPEQGWNEPCDFQNKSETFGLLENLIELAILSVTSAGTAIFLSERPRPAPYYKTSHDRSFEWET